MKLDKLSYNEYVFNCLTKFGQYYLSFFNDEVVDGWQCEKEMLKSLGFFNVYYDLNEKKVVWKDFKKNKEDVSDVDYSELVVILRRYKFSNMCLESDISYIDSLIKRFGGDEK